MKKLNIFTLALIAIFALTPANASDTKGSHSGDDSNMKASEKDQRGSHSGDHSAMKAPEGNKEAKAIGVINTIDAEKKSINVTHEPVESLGWPKMTMDLPITKRVDLSNIKTGEKVEFTLKLGRDKKFRVINIEAAK